MLVFSGYSLRKMAVILWCGPWWSRGTRQAYIHINNKISHLGEVERWQRQTGQPHHLTQFHHTRTSASAPRLSSWPGQVSIPFLTKHNKPQNICWIKEWNAGAETNSKSMTTPSVSMVSEPWPSKQGKIKTDFLQIIKVFKGLHLRTFTLEICAVPHVQRRTNCRLFTLRSLSPQDSVERVLPHLACTDSVVHSGVL